MPQEPHGWHVRRTAAAAIACFLVGLACAAQAQPVPFPALAPAIPGVGLRDPRVAVDADRVPWRAVVRVQTELGVHCSGVLIGASLALTAAHCLESPFTHRPVAPSSVHVLSGYRLGRYAGHAVALSLRIAAGYDAAQGLPSEAAANEGADWAVLRLSAPLGALGRTLPLAATPVGIGTRVVLGGYDADRIEQMVADLNCVVTGWATDAAARPLIMHDCSATSGSSGAPLLARVGGEWKVVGLEVAARRGIGGGIAVPLTARRR